MNEKTTGGRGGRGPSSPPRGKGASGDEGPRNPGSLGPASPGAEAQPVRGTGPTAGGDPRDGSSGAGPGGRAGAVRGAEAAQRSPAETPRSAGWGGGPSSGRLPRPGRGSAAAVPALFPACSRGQRALAVQPDPSRHSQAAGGRGAQQPPAPGSESAEPGPCRAGGLQRHSGPLELQARTTRTDLEKSECTGPGGRTYRRRAAKGRHGLGASHAQGRWPGLSIPAAAPGTGFAPGMSNHRSAPVP